MDSVKKLLSSQTASLSSHALTSNVEQYGADDNQAEYEVLYCRRNGQQGEAVTQNSDDQRAEHGTNHGALAAHEGAPPMMQAAMRRYRTAGLR